MSKIFLLAALAAVFAVPVRAQTLPPGCVWINQDLGWYQCGNDIHRGIVASESAFVTKSAVSTITDKGRRAN